MPVFNPTLPAIALQPSQAGLDERKINRSILLDVAPDREQLLMSDIPIEEIRHHLKLRIASPEGHWLYRAQKLREVKLRNATTRFSAFDLAGLAATSANANANAAAPKPAQPTQIPTRRRVLSSSATPTHPIQLTQSIERRFSFFDNSNQSTANTTTTTTTSSDTWYDLSLSTPGTLVSPRPLGPTHILIIYSTTPFNSVTHSLVARKKPTLRRKNNFNMTFPEIIEIPINDLLFLLSVPNIQAKFTDGEPDYSILPRRLHKELPRVLMRVPHLDTFPEFIAYMHTMNQGELFRKLIPEWIRDLIHPLLMVHTSFTTPTPSTDSQPDVDFGSVFRLLGQLVTGKDRCSDREEECTEEMLSSLAREIAEFSIFVLGDTNLEETTDGVVDTAAVLDALCDNLHYVGYYDKNLWHELRIYRSVLHRAVMWKGKIESEMGTIEI